MTAYDQVPFPSLPLVESHPDRLAAVAKLSGLQAADPEHCRVLEIGCASGGNLMPMASALSGSQFVGLDASAVGIKAAASAAKELGLSNATWITADVEDWEQALEGEEPFDFVICSGLFSWVSSTAQDEILRLCRALLSPQGVATLNYNALPGWQSRLALRDLLRMHCSGFGDSAVQIAEARALLVGLEDGLEQGPHGPPLTQALAELKAADDAYLFHEYLGEENRPLAIHEFVARAEAAELMYMGEVAFEDTRFSLLPGLKQPGLERGSKEFVALAFREDLLSGRSYRCSLLARADAEVHSGAPNLEGLYAACRILPRAGERALSSTIPEPFSFVTEGERRVSVADPLVKAAVVVLSEAWPQALPVDALEGKASALLEREPGGAGPARLSTGLLDLFGAGVLRLTPRSLRPCLEPGDSPLAFPAARAQARRSPVVANLLHQAQGLTPAERVLLAALDGETDRSALVSRLVAASQEGLLRVSADGVQVSEANALANALTEALPEQLAGLARKALLLA